MGRLNCSESTYGEMELLASDRRAEHTEVILHGYKS